MKKLILCAVCLLLISASPAPAQSGNAMTDSLKGVFGTVKGYITNTAEQVSEANYSFKATPDVRSMGALIGHIADANFMFCSIASGAANPMQGVSIEKTKTSKADLQKALADSFAFCDAQYSAMTDAKGTTEMVDLFGRKHPRLGVLALNNAHDFEHYGNLVTYMRLKGMVPPSSQKGGM
jgi:uncharacterized damage-inducible protein DinB